MQNSDQVMIVVHVYHVPMEVMFGDRSGQFGEGTSHSGTPSRVRCPVIRWEYIRNRVLCRSYNL